MGLFGLFLVGLLVAIVDYAKWYFSLPYVDAGADWECVLWTLLLFLVGLGLDGFLGGKQLVEVNIVVFDLKIWQEKGPETVWAMLLWILFERYQSDDAGTGVY